ncbi:MAG: hypothetical protein KBC36_04510, partial [Spirochaetia bacterium]|nr:hypothetical protein [Spirochaetia bacterium]
MNGNFASIKHALRAAFAIAAFATLAIHPVAAQAAPSRIVVAGRASIMVADALYAFPSARARTVAVAGADQGLGYFLGALDPAWAALPPLDRA